MEEQQFRDTYHLVNQRRCVFEKAINSRRCSCDRCQRFNLADREGVACKTASGNALCNELLNTMRSKSRFALHLTHADGPLPHTKEIKVQTGGLLGLQALLHPEQAAAVQVENIIKLLDTAIQRYGRLADLPFDLIVQAIVRFEGRSRRR
jgi:hypothetical protein